MKFRSTTLHSLVSVPRSDWREFSTAQFTRSTTLLPEGPTVETPEIRVLPEVAQRKEICWNARYHLGRMLGRGAQGVVFLARREGVDGYGTYVAVKFFARHRDHTLDEYRAEMRRIARQAERVSEIQNDAIVAVRDFVAVEETRVMVMEWVDGFDLSQLLDLRRLERLRRTLSRPEWERLTDVVVSTGPDQCRLKSGIAVDIVRGCLAGLSDLQHHGIVHCDLKPSNIMIKRTGSNKIIDFDSSCVLDEDHPTILRGTPYYMAPEQLRDGVVGTSSDIASLGYMLIEMLTGRLIFQHCEDVPQLLAAKLALPRRLESVLPAEVKRDPLLFGLCGKMIAVDPDERFSDAEAADLDRLGAASFHRKLVKRDMSTEYDRELAWWIDACHRST